MKEQPDDLEFLKNRVKSLEEELGRFLDFIEDDPIVSMFWVKEQEKARKLLKGLDTPDDP
jgi:hypothetical protein